AFETNGPGWGAPAVFWVTLSPMKRRLLTGAADSTTSRAPPFMGHPSKTRIRCMGRSGIRGRPSFGTERLAGIHAARSSRTEASRGAISKGDTFDGRRRPAHRWSDLSRLMTGRH